MGTTNVGMGHTMSGRARVQSTTEGTGRCDFRVILVNADANFRVVIVVNDDAAFRTSSEGAVPRVAVCRVILVNADGAGRCRWTSLAGPSIRG